VFKRHHQAAVLRGHEASAPDRWRAGGRLHGAPRAGLSGRLYALAGLVAQIARRAFRRRVQSVALRLVCDRELEIEKFVPREYLVLVATLATARGETFEARLVGATARRSSASISAPARKPMTSRSNRGAPTSRNNR